MTCLHRENREMVREWSDDMVRNVRKLHYKQPMHSDPEYLGQPGTKGWSTHMAWKTIVRHEWRRRGCP